MKPAALLLLLSVLTRARAEGGVSLVIVGGGGDLAQRYLWPGLLALSRRLGEDFPVRSIVSGSREDATSGLRRLESILVAAAACEAGDASCAGHLDAFRARVHFAQLAGPSDYGSLSSALSRGSAPHGERGRVFYLSVPPSAFEAVSASIRDRAAAPGDAWTRIVFEKPIGHDLASAEALLAATGAALPAGAGRPMLVDHYLAKAGVRAMPAFFAHANAGAGSSERAGWASLLDAGAAHLVSVRAELVEDADLLGRTRFYEGVGVIRDVLQSHVTEMVASALARPRPGETWATARLRALRAISPVSPDAVLLGQYSGYAAHVCTDREERVGCAAGARAAQTPTWAAALTGWTPGEADPGAAPVPVVMVAGKGVPGAGRSAFVSLRLCSRPALRAGATRSCDDGEEFELRFNVQGGGDGLGESVVVANASAPQLPGLPGFLPPTERAHVDHGRQHILRPAAPPRSAYEELLLAAVAGDADTFVEPDEVRELWRVWDPVVCEGQACRGGQGQSVAAPRLYRSNWSLRFHWYVDQRGRPLITFDRIEEEAATVPEASIVDDQVL